MGFWVYGRGVHIRVSSINLRAKDGFQEEEGLWIWCEVEPSRLADLGLGILNFKA